MKPLVSVIVPVFKVEPYIHRCVSSLLSQTLQEIEIILVDDGSPDKCPEICDDFAAKDGRVRVIHQANKGLADARNTGLDTASSGYVMFVDSDDWVEPDFCRIPWECAEETGSDLVMFSGFKHRKGSVIQWHAGQDGVKEKETAVMMLGMGAGYAVWSKLYKKELFDRIRFPSGKYFEDAVITSALVHEAGKIYCTDTPLYHYCIREDNITSTKTHRMVRDCNELSVKRILFLEEKGYQEEADRTRPGVYWKYLVEMGRHEEYSEMCRNAIVSLKEIPASFSQESRLMIILLKYVPWMFDLVCIATGRRVG